MHENANREFRKIPSLKFLYEINRTGTIVRNVKSKKHLRIERQGKQYTVLVPQGKRDYISISIPYILSECWQTEATQKQIEVKNEIIKILFQSQGECIRWFLEEYPDAKRESIRQKLKAHRHHIYDYDITYLSK